MNKKIIFSSGGTGGHILPAVNLMKHFIIKGYEVTLVTDHKGSGFIKNNEKIKTYIIKAETVTKKNIFKKILSLIVIFFSIFKSILILKKEKADIVISFGGYVSFPISLASFFFKIPLIAYENNLVLGRANKYLLPILNKIIISIQNPINFPNKYRKKIEIVGPILNKNIIDYKFKKKELNKNFSILVLGGSQGAEVFGKVIPKTVSMLKQKGYEININQQCLKNQKKEITDFYIKNKIKNNVFEFDSNILNLILSTDLAIARCGASTTAELAHTCTPFIAIPYPYALDNHQLLNDKFYEKKKYCWLLEESSFNSSNLFHLIDEIIINKKNLENIRQNMKNNYSNQVYVNIENIVKDLIKK